MLRTILPYSSIKPSNGGVVAISGIDATPGPLTLIVLPNANQNRCYSAIELSRREHRLRWQSKQHTRYFLEADSLVSPAGKTVLRETGKENDVPLSLLLT